VQPGQIKVLKTGWVVGVPKDYFLAIFARSSTPKKKGLFVANGVGVLDSDYRGETDELGILVYNHTDEPVTISAGDRIAQGIILPAPRATFVNFDPAASSRGGFGSTGK
jgi:dUTP pyrophosphatase